MNDNHIEIKEKRNSLIAKGIIFLFLSVFSLTIALLPYIVSEFKDNALVFYLGGGIAFCCFATMFVYLLLNECNPDSILLLNSRGFTDKKNIGANIEIEWTNVATVKLMGKKEMPYLGITLENADLVMAHMKKNYVEEMRKNIEEGLPHILISQREIRYPINELKELFVKFTREARALKNDIPAKPKNNPFTTEDVLRAFGKLEPLKPEEQTDISSVQNETEPKETEVTSYTAVQQDSADTKINQTDNEIKSVSSFYETLVRQTESVDPIVHDEEKIDREDAEEQTSYVSIENEAPKQESKNDFNDEFIELISKAKSSKIAEIEKLLNEKDIPFSAARTKQSVDEEVQSAPIEDKNDDAQHNSKIKQSTTNDMSNTKEFYPEIIHFDDL